MMVSLNIKLEVAIEILAVKIASQYQNDMNIKSKEKDGKIGRFFYKAYDDEILNTIDIFENLEEIKNVKKVKMRSKRLKLINNFSLFFIYFNIIKVIENKVVIDYEEKKIKKKAKD